VTRGWGFLDLSQPRPLVHRIGVLLRGKVPRKRRG